jgi:hypothetical protein
VTAHAGRPTVVVVGVAASPLPVAGMTAARAGAPPSAFDRPH